MDKNQSLQKRSTTQISSRVLRVHSKHLKWHCG